MYFNGFLCSRKSFFSKSWVNIGSDGEKKILSENQRKRTFLAPINNEVSDEKIKLKKKQFFSLRKELCPCQVGDKFICLGSHFTIIWIIYGLYGNIYCHRASLTNPTKFLQQTKRQNGRLCAVFKFVNSSISALICFKLKSFV